MTEHHWISRLLMALLPFLFLSSTLFVPECAGQGNANFFYYYSPTQRTQISHGFGGTSPGNIFNSPFFTQQQQQPQPEVQQTQQQPVAQQSEQSAQQVQPTAQPFPTQPSAAFQQSTFLGFNHPHFQQQQSHRFFPPAPPAQLQFPLVQPTPSQQPPQQQQQPFGAFTGFGPNAQFFGQLPSQPSYYSTQAPLGTVTPGAFNFFQNPFQYLQQQFIQSTVAPVEAPAALPGPTSTAVPPPPPPSPTPTDAAEVVDAPTTEITPRPRISSRFRYVQQPTQPLIRQYNPYTRINSPYTSDLPYTEQRFYSSPTTPTGYAFSLGGESGSTSTVHFSMGPTSKNIQQHLTEITAPRRALQRQRFTQSIAQVVRTPEPVTEMTSPEPTMPTTTTTTPQPPSTTSAPTTPAPTETILPLAVMTDVAPVAPSEASMNSTLEPLLNEPSFQTETIAAPASSDPVSPDDVSRKISETNIPTRLVIRKKVARKRLQLASSSGEMADNNGVMMMPNGIMIRRRIGSPNRLPIDEPKETDEQLESQKGSAQQEIPVVDPVTFTSTTTTTQAPVEVEQPPHEEEQPEMMMMMEPQPVSSTTAAPQDIAPMSHDEEELPLVLPEEAHMTMEMPESHSVQQEPEASMPDEHAEQQPAMIQNEPEEHQPEAPPAVESSTTPTPIQPPPVESLMMDPAQPKNQDSVEEVYYEDEYEDEVVQPKSNPDQHSARKVMTAVMAPESSAELPLLNGVSKEDFPGVFHPHSDPSDNSVETDQGQVITRVTSSVPSSEEQMGGEMVDVPVSASPSSTTTEPALPASPDFMKSDPVDEHPPVETEVPPVPMFQPLTTTEATPLMMTTTQAPMTSSTQQSSDSEERFSSGEVQSAEEHNDEAQPVAIPPQETPVEMFSTEGPSSTTEASDEPVASQDDAGDSMPSSTESLSPEQPMNGEVSHVPETQQIDTSSTTEVMPSSSSTEMTSSSSTTEESVVSSDMEMASPSASSTESTQNEEVSTSSSSTTMAPPTDLKEQSMADNVPVSQEVADNNENAAHSEEVISDSEEIGRAQRLALEETLRRLRERQQTSSSTSDPVDDEDSPDNDISGGRKMFMRRPLPSLANLPLPTSRPVTNIHAVLDEEDGVDRSQVIEKIQRFRQNFRTTTTKRPRRVTRPSPGSERRVAVVAPVVEDLLERQAQVDSFSDSSSTPGPAAEATTTIFPTTPSSRSYFRGRTTSPSSTTTVLPEESSTTPATLTMEDMQEEMNPEDAFFSSTEQSMTTTVRPPLLTRLTDEASSTTESMLMTDEVSSTTETDIEPMTSRTQPETTTTSASSTTTTELPFMTTTNTPVAPRTTMPSTTSTDASTFDEENDSNDLVYEDNFDNSQNGPVFSSSSSTTEVSTEAEVDTTPSSTTIAPLSSTDSVYAYVTTPEPISDGSLLSSTTIDPDISSSTTMTTPAGQLIIHEILPTMPPLKEVSFVIGESVEDDQSSGGASASSSASESDELLAADRAVVRVETNVHVVTNATDISTESGSGEQVSRESQELTPPLATNTSGEGGQQQKRVRVVVKKQRRLRRPTGQTGSKDSRRRRRKVLHRRRPQ